MNIWLINAHALPVTEGGGTRHYSHARELIARGHKVEIVACSFQHLTHRQMQVPPGTTWIRRECDGVPFTWIHARGYGDNSYGRVFNMLQFASRLWRGRWASELPKPDLILGSSPHPFTALAAERLASRYRVPFVLEVRDLWPYVLTEVGGLSPRHPFVLVVDKVMRFLYRRAARIIMFSGSSADFLARYGADRGKIEWIPNGVDLALCPPPRPAPDDGRFTVSYLGAHNRWNSLGVLLDAAKLLQQAGMNQVQFRFVGDGGEKPALMERTRNEGVNNVEFHSMVPKKQVPELLHTSDALIINSRRDGVSKNWMSYNKIYDYLASGRPIVFGCCASDDPVRESGAGISVEADNSVELARAVASLASQPADKLWELGMRGRRYVEENYSVARLAARFEQLAFRLTTSPQVRKNTPAERSGAASLAGQ